MDNEKFQKSVLEQLEVNKEFQKTVIDQLVRLTQEVTEVRQSQVRIEDEHGKKIEALFDARQVQNDVSEEFRGEFRKINEKLDRLTESKILKRIK